MVLERFIALLQYNKMCSILLHILLEIKKLKLELPCMHWKN